MRTLRFVLAGIAAVFGMLLALPVIVMALPFLAVAVLTRALVRVLEPRFVTWQDVIEFHPIIGWKPKANLNTHGLADEVFHLATDSQGWRGTATLAQSDVVVFGDSFAFGQGANEEGFFSELNPKLRIKAIGSPGYNMVQELLWMQRLSSQLTGKLVVWFIYYGNDLFENLVPDMCNYRTPFVREINGVGTWEITTSHVRPVKWFHPGEPRVDRRDYYQKIAEVCSSTLLSERAYSACEFLIRKGRDMCSHVGAPLVVMTIPEKTQLSPEGTRFLLSRGGDPKSFDPDFPDHRISEMCRKLDVPFIAGKSHLDLTHYKERDPHWNPRGHQRVSDVLSAFYHDFVLARNRPE